MGGVCIERRWCRMRHSHVGDEPRPHADVLRPLQDGVNLPRAADVVLQILVLCAAVETNQFEVGFDAGEERRRRRRAVRHLGVHGVGLKRRRAGISN